MRLPSPRDSRIKTKRTRRHATRLAGVSGAVSLLCWSILAGGCATAWRTTAFRHVELTSAGAVSLGVLLLDYNSCVFEGAVVYHYPPCAPCLDDSLPLSVEYHPPGDFGDIRFTYLPNGDTVFYGTIIWMGTGQMEVPTGVLPPDQFARSAGDAPYPERVQCFLCNQDPPTAIWNAISSLDLVKAFQGPSLRVGVYRYGPRTGMFDPAVAKWVVFLYTRG